MKLFQEMHDNDRESFIKSFRVNPDQFDYILSLISERIAKDSKYWSSTDFRSTAALVIGQFLAALRKK